MPIALGERAPRVPARTTSIRSSIATSLDRDWEQWREEGCHDAQSRLVEYYIGTLVRPIALRIHAGLPAVIDVDDLIQQGYFGLTDAMKRFQHDRETRFETFARPRVRGAIQDYLRSIDHVPRLTRMRSKQVQAAQERFHKEHGRPATFEDLGDVLDLPDPRQVGIHRFLADHRANAVVSFSSVSPDGAEDSHEIDAMDSFEDTADTSPLDDAARGDLQTMITRGFDRRDRLIVILYYYEQMTMREIGESLGVSESRVSQRLDSIHQCLRARLMRSELEHEFVFA